MNCFDNYDDEEAWTSAINKRNFLFDRILKEYHPPEIESDDNDGDDEEKNDSDGEEEEEENDNDGDDEEENDNDPPCGTLGRIGPMPPSCEVSKNLTE